MLEMPANRELELTAPEHCREKRPRQNQKQNATTPPGACANICEINVFQKHWRKKRTKNVFEIYYKKMLKFFLEKLLKKITLQKFRDILI